jgi:hypothetical protein
MLAQADFHRALALALGEFAEAWTIVGECAPVDRFDASHWGSGPQSFQVTLRHRVTGHLKVLGRRVAYEPGASVHPAVALSLIGAYRHGNAEPIRQYFEEIGVAAVAARDFSHFFERSSPAPSSRAVSAQAVPAGTAVADLVSEPRAAASVSEVVETDSRPPGNGASRSWNLGFRKPVSLPTSPPSPIVKRSVRGPSGDGRRRPMLGRLKRELAIWYWRRGAGSSQDKDKGHARD